MAVEEGTEKELGEIVWVEGGLFGEDGGDVAHPVFILVVEYECDVAGPAFDAGGFGACFDFESQLDCVGAPVAHGLGVLDGVGVEPFGGGGVSIDGDEDLPVDDLGECGDRNIVAYESVDVSVEGCGALEQLVCVDREIEVGVDGKRVREIGGRGSRMQAFMGRDGACHHVGAGCVPGLQCRCGHGCSPLE